MTRSAPDEHRKRVRQRAPVVERLKQVDRALIHGDRLALGSGDVMRHREQVHRLGDAALVPGGFEDRECFIVMRNSRARIFAIDEPVADAVQAARNEHWIVDGSRDLERLPAKVAGALVVARRPQHAQCVQRHPLGAALAVFASGASAAVKSSFAC